MVATSPIRIGTRNSALALAQTRQIAEGLRHPYQIVPIISTGDRISGPLRDHGGKFLFTKEIDAALLAGEIDLAVHSMKDVETPLIEGLEIAAVGLREDPRDVLIAKPSMLWPDFERGLRIGTSSLRRAHQLLRVTPNVTVVPCRGNIQTRLQKFENGEFDAIILALAGLKRLGLWSDNRIVGIEANTTLLDLENFVPAPGQGALVVLKRQNDQRFDQSLRFINHYQSFLEVQIERMVIDGLDLTCHDPVGSYCTVNQDRFFLNFMLFDKNKLLQKNLSGQLESIDILLQVLIKDLKKL